MIPSTCATPILADLYVTRGLVFGTNHTYTTYLVVTEASPWERDWQNYRANGYFAYVKAQALLFLVLGVFASLFPFALALIFSPPSLPIAGLTVVAVASGLYSLVIGGMGFGRWFDREGHIEDRWRRTLAASMRASEASDADATGP